MIARVYELELIPRKTLSGVVEALADTRVVTINGARQSGKSTLAKVVAVGGRTSFRMLDDPDTLQAARRDPMTFVEHDGLMVIDEVQLAPELFRPIKLVVDRDPRPGRFLLTGSARILALRDLPDALTGRIEIIELWPLSQGEIGDGPDRFVDAAFEHGKKIGQESGLRKRDYLELAVRGGFPEAVRRTARRRPAFFESYLTTLIERDIRDLSSIERHGELRRLLALLAGRAGGLFSPTAVSTQTGIPNTTVRRYIDLLALVFLIKEIPAWSSSSTGRALRSPKLGFVDSGLLAHLLGQSLTRLADPGGAAGPLLENLVLMELARQLTWSETRARLYHYRTKDGTEVDAVVEAADGRIIGIEVKAGATVRAEDTAGLRHLADRLGDRFVAGYLLYTGQQALPFGDRLKLLPIDNLWRTQP
jgi:predicted AAA+ superfamily ATPase